MPTVFVPHLAMRYAENGQRIPAKDISQAAQFGNLKIVIEGTTNNPIIQTCQEEVAKIMAEYKEGDYILAIGSPVIISLCAIEVAKRFTEVQFLRWAREQQTYIYERVKV